VCAIDRWKAPIVEAVVTGTCIPGAYDVEGVNGFAVRVIENRRTCPFTVIDFLLAALTCGFRAAGPRPKLKGVASLGAGESENRYSVDGKRIDVSRGVVLKYAFTIFIVKAGAKVFEVS